MPLKSSKNQFLNNPEGVIDTEAGDLLRSRREATNDHKLNGSISNPGQQPDTEKVNLTSESAPPKDQIRQNVNTTKHPTMLERPSTSEEFSIDGRRVFYSPDRNKELLSREVRTPFADIGISPETIKARVFTEYFSMIDDWVIVADMKLNIVSNNYSAKIVDNVVNKFNKQKKRINVQNLTGNNPNITLDECFKFVEREQIRCTEETIMNLIDIYSMLNYKQKKHSSEEVEKFKENKILPILKYIENLDSGIKISNKQEENVHSSGFKKVSKLKSSMRAINIKNSNLTVEMK